MGYYTSYTLSILEGGDEDQLIPEFRKDSEGAMYAIDEYGYTKFTGKV